MEVTAVTVEETPKIEAKEHSSPRKVAGVLRQPADQTNSGMPDQVGNGEARPHTQGILVEPLQEHPTDADLVVSLSPPPNHILSSKCCRGTNLQGRKPKNWGRKGKKGQFRD